MEPQNNDSYICKPCNYKTDRKFNYKQHLETIKHKEIAEFKCDRCGNYYKHQPNLYRHRSKCAIQESQPTDKNTQNDNSNFVTKDDIAVILTTVVEINNKFQNNIIESVMDNNKNMLESIIVNNKNMLESVMDNNKNMTDTIVENNKTTVENVVNACVTIDKNRNEKKEKFNLDNYLNNTCKNAINIEDFAKKIDPTYEDVVCVGKNGYVEGNAAVILKYLNTMKQTERPIQCSDVKRHTVYLKSEGKWEKETEELEKTSNVVNRICNKTYRNKKLWMEKHPDYQEMDSKSGVQYLMLVKAMSGGGQDVDELNEQIAKKVVKQCAINK